MTAAVWSLTPVVVRGDLEAMLVDRTRDSLWGIASPKTTRIEEMEISTEKREDE